MSSLTLCLLGPWGTPIVSGLLIVVAAIFSLTAGVNPFGAGHQHGIGFSLEGPTALVVSDLFMIAAALVAGIPIILKRSEEHTSELQSRGHLVCRLLLEKKNKNKTHKESTSD